MRHGYPSSNEHYPGYVVKKIDRCHYVDHNLQWCAICPPKRDPASPVFRKLRQCLHESIP